ncbi:hypothetical protein KKF84_13930 [Myxococcota bacterium]|nr:hypothetical protein [Myxococcota bacterium]MBU1536421.1 hypothetical protein [Myxococcota bacterium]
MKRVLSILLFVLIIPGCFFDPSGYVDNPYVEKLCEDGIDNDDDGFIDCEDQDCCTKDICANSGICTEVEDQPDNQE